MLPDILKLRCIEPLQNGLVRCHVHSYQSTWVEKGVLHNPDFKCGEGDLVEGRSTDSSAISEEVCGQESKGGETGEK